MRYIIACLCLVLVVACASPAGAETASAEARISVRSHPYGTLLQDRDGHLWVAGSWPTRVPLDPASPAAQRFRRQTPIMLTDDEATCLRPSDATWVGREEWIALVQSSGAYWYADEIQRARRPAHLRVMEAWGDDPSTARTLTFEELAQYREGIAMPVPSGTLIQSDGRLFYALDNAFRPFVSEAVARSAGYRPEEALRLSSAELAQLGRVGAVLTAEDFARCPTEEALARQTEDWDGDGVHLPQDCDDHNPAIRPGAEELCDERDNDCDDETDEGFDTGLSCTDPRAPDRPARTVCAPDGRRAVCEAEDENAW
ncbi:MAG: putative metal-binding motif-containing protein [Patescibacteria group bacterium]